MTQMKNYPEMEAEAEGGGEDEAGCTGAQRAGLSYSSVL